ncbi:MAG: methylisocitrate lyase [Rhodospirillales bacterium]|jgi:methylisocitrate lyase|nr:methylisocitrate lyase [Rhodospirillales bacterium]
MTWLQHDDAPRTPAGERFGALLAEQRILRIPGAHNAMAGLLAKDAGFDALYVSGAAVCASLGLPDLGILTLEELCLVTRSIARVTGLPILADGDTGYGEALNAMRLVRELEQAGAAAVQIEDQVLPKKCGHLNDKTLVTPEQMAAKIAAAAAARTHLRIVARSDAFADEGLDGLVRRARLYMDAGADAIFPEALTSPEDFAAVAKALDCPLLANMTEFGRSPSLAADQLEEMGYKMVIWPVSSLRIAAHAMGEFYAQLATDGTTEPQLSRMQTRKRLYEVIKYGDYEALDGTIIKSVAP